MPKHGMRNFIVVIDRNRKRIIEVLLMPEEDQLSKKILRKLNSKLFVNHKKLTKKFPFPTYAVILGRAKDLDTIKLSFHENWDKTRIKNISAK